MLGVIDFPSRMLGGLQAERANLYSMIGDLFCEPPREQTIAAAISSLEADRPPPQLATAHALLIRALRLALEVDVAQEYADLFRSSESPFQLRSCSDADGTRIASVGQPMQDRVRHMLHLAMHADRCAHAISEQDPREAVEASEAGRQMIAGHAGPCLFDLALHLEGSNRPFFSALGLALRELIERDLGELRARGAPVRRWLALSVQEVHRGDGEVVLQSLVRCPQQMGEAVALECCQECGRWDGMQFGAKDCPPMILCNGASQ